MVKVGMKVKWNDKSIVNYPMDEQETLLERVFTIDKIDGEVITISNEYSEAKVLESELIILKKC